MRKLILLLFPAALHAQVKLPAIIRDSMVLQRNTGVRIWGWASADEKVSVKFNNKTYQTTARDGQWVVTLAPQKAGGPYAMTISGKNTITLKDILIGDVWVCSGQSNMEHQLKLHEIFYAKEIADADNPAIRQFKVPNTTSLEGPKNDLPGGAWKSANPTAVRDFSAVAYFFAQELYTRYHVPIGIINSSWGGIPIEAMMSAESLKAFPFVTSRPADTSRGAPQPEDLGLVEHWADTAYQPKGWHRIAIPGYWEDQGAKNLHGIVWYRREVDIPASMAAKAARIFLGRIVDADEVYVNGQKVGSTGYLYPQRRYVIPAGLLHAGRNLIAIRITNYLGKGGFVADKPYQLVADGDSLALTGYWLYKPGYIAPAGQLMRAPSGGNTQNQPTALYNAMIAPITNYAIKGFVWYQGESNTGHPEQYAQLQPAMIKDWRAKWQDDRLPFLFVQLPGFMDYSYLPIESNWALFREAQSRSLNLPNTGMAVAIDLGEWNDVHPDRKKEVGQRLALIAQKIAYHENIPYTGPSLQTSTIKGDSILLTFSTNLSTTDGEAPHDLAIAGEDKKFVWAQAIIRNNTLIVHSPSIPAPRYVRYAWADAPISPNLTDATGLPAPPFRTDQ